MSNIHMGLKEFHDLHRSLDKNNIIMDVRNPNEFQEAHIKGAVNFPLPELAQHINELQKFERIYIHCKKGGRAKIAFEILENAGLKNLVCISDAGMDTWIEEGFEFQRG